MSSVSKLVTAAAAVAIGFGCGWIHAAFQPEEAREGRVPGKAAADAPGAKDRAAGKVPAPAAQNSTASKPASYSEILRGFLQPNDQLDHLRIPAVVRRMTPEEAAGQVPQLMTEFAAHDWILRGLIEGWAEVDVPRALAFLETRPGDLRRWQQPFIRGWARHDPAAAEAWVAGRPPHSGSTELRLTLLESMATVDPGNALDAMVRHGWDSPNGLMARSLWSNWAATDPRAAWERLRTMVPESVSSRNGSGIAITAFSRGLYFAEPDKAAAFLRSAPDNEFVAIFTSSPSEIMDALPAERMALIQRATAAKMSSAFVLQWAESHPVDALRLAAENPNDPAVAYLRESVLKGGSLRNTSWPWTDEEAEVIRQAQAAAAPETRVESARQVLNQQVFSGTGNRSLAVEAWSAVDSREQEMNASGFFYRITEKDPAMGQQLFNALPEGPIRAAALPEYCRCLALTAPEDAWRTAMAIQDPAARAAAAAYALAGWASSDAGAATARLQRDAASLDLARMDDALTKVGRVLSGSAELRYYTGFDTGAIRGSIHQLRATP